MPSGVTLPMLQPLSNFAFLKPPAAGDLGTGELAALGHAVDGEAVQAELGRHFLESEQFVAGHPVALSIPFAAICCQQNSAWSPVAA